MSMRCVKAVFLMLLFASCRSEPTLFEKLNVDEIGIGFVNTVEETSDFNMLTYEYIYNGAGVAAADFSGNGYPDLFFVGNMTENRLYLNHGDFRFEDISKAAGVKGNNQKWYSGVAVTDINKNGLPDIYLSATGREDPDLRRNELYVNLGPDEDGIPRFREMAADFGLDDNSFTTQAYFFDANGNGYQDLYLLTAHSASGSSYTNVAAQRESEGDQNLDRLLISEWSEDGEKRIFSNRSEEFGITKGGYGLGVNLMDVTGNGLTDLYVANDYITDDLFWINNGDGTFTDRGPELFTHYSFSAMGTDFGDLSGNGRQDIYTLDMLPEINVRRMMMANPNNYRNFVNDAFRGHHPQYTRNTLQIDMGPDPDTGLPIYSETALSAGVGATDWSWATLLADFDNDGRLDIFVTNGIPRDITDKDFWAEYGRVRSVMPMEMALPKIPQVKIPNVMFKNLGTEEGDPYGVQFEDISAAWGITEPTYSTGAVMADLNNDGRLDLVVNNINQPAGIYRNRGGATDENGSWLRVISDGPEHNRFGVGMEMEIWSEGESVTSYRHRLQRGYLSSVDPVIHVGLGSITQVDSLIVQWPADTEGNRLRSMVERADLNSTVTVQHTDAGQSYRPEQSERLTERAYQEISGYVGLSFIHHHTPVNDLHNQPMLPYKHSAMGPAIAVGDLNGNGLDDIFAGGSSGEPPVILWQNEDGSFRTESFTIDGYPQGSNRTDSAVLVFDATGNGLPDIYIGAGGVSLPRGDSGYRDLLFLNQGEGSFQIAEEALPDLAYSTSIVLAEDLTGNGLPDLFVGGDVIQGRYPEGAPSSILINESVSDRIRFTDRTEEFAPDVRDFGPVKDAQFADLNGNGSKELILATDWKPVTVFAYENGIFRNITDELGLGGDRGWWFSTYTGDLTGNGRTDLIAGNLGLNSGYRTGEGRPIRLYHGDLTGDGFYESIPTHYIKDSDGVFREFTYGDRDDFNRQMPEAGSRVPTHREYGETPLREILTNEELNRAAVAEVNRLESMIYTQSSEGRFEGRPLPLSAQSSVLFGVQTAHIAESETLDLLLAGNFEGADLQTGSYNAMKGLVLRLSEDGGFSVDSPAASGFHADGDVRRLHSIHLADGRAGVLVHRLNEPLLIFVQSD